MKKIFFFLFVLLSANSFAQTREELLDEFRRERAKMMQEIQKMFSDDLVGGDDFFGDSFFDTKSFKSAGDDVAVEQNYEKNGNITILITPKNKNVQLDIKTLDNMITIKSETKIEEVNEEGGQQQKSFSSSSFTKSVGIPSGYKAKNPEQDGDSIKISLVPQAKIKNLMAPKPKSDKVPIGKQFGGDTI